QVLVEIAAAHQRPPDRADGVDDQREDEEDDGSEAPVGKPLQPGERARNRGGQEPTAADAGLRNTWMSCRPSSAAGRNVTASKSSASSRPTYSAGWYALQRLVPAELS